jgi:hypothetical protein
MLGPPTDRCQSGGKHHVMTDAMAVGHRDGRQPQRGYGIALQACRPPAATPDPIGRSPSDSREIAAMNQTSSLRCACDC